MPSIPHNEEKLVLDQASQLKGHVVHCIATLSPVLDFFRLTQKVVKLCS